MHDAGDIVADTEPVDAGARLDNDIDIIVLGYYAMSGTSQKNSKIQKFKNSTVEKRNISLVQLTNAAISLLN